MHAARTGSSSHRLPPTPPPPPAAPLQGNATRAKTDALQFIDYQNM